MTKLKNLRLFQSIPGVPRASWHRKIMKDENDVAVTMVAILGTMLAVIGGLVTIQTRIPGGDSRLLPCPTTEPSKRAYEKYALAYTPVWIVGFAIIVAFKLYEDFDKWSYMKVCVGLSLPFLLQPILALLQLFWDQ